MKSILLFDLDGTLTDPAKGITNSFAHALKSFGLEIPSYEKLCSFIGPPLIDTFKKEFGFTAEQADEGVKKYREYFADKGLFENEVYDGIPELLSKLKSIGYRLFVATSKPEEYSIRIAEHFGFAKYFEKICGSNMDESRSKKSEVIEYALRNAKDLGENSKAGEKVVGAIDGESSLDRVGGGVPKSEVLMIGDRRHDVIGANENGIESCGVLFGYGNRTELEEAGATYIAESVMDLENILFDLRRT